MAEEKTETVNTNKASILAQVKGELKGEQLKAAKAQIKTKYSDLLKAREIVSRIENEIVEIIASVGEDAETVKALLAD